MPGKRQCAYCGEVVSQTTQDHIFPRGLFPSSVMPLKVNRLTVPACSTCNSSFSDDEAHFRNVIVLAGPESEVATQLWAGKIRRSLQRPDSRRRLLDLSDILEQTVVDGVDRLTIYPARDERVLRVVRKSVRGLTHEHKLGTALPDSRVWADVLRYDLPPDMEDELVFRGSERDVVEYAYLERPYDDIESLWVIRYFGRTTFIASVSASNEHAARLTAP